jgi:hypothetical protein
MMGSQPKPPAFTFNYAQVLHEAKLAKYAGITQMVLGYLAGIRSWFEIPPSKSLDEQKVGSDSSSND